jgi:hypothetical protein
MNKEPSTQFGETQTISSARFEFGLGFDFVAAAFRVLCAPTICVGEAGKLFCFSWHRLACLCIDRLLRVRGKGKSFRDLTMIQSATS